MRFTRIFVLSFLVCFVLSSAEVCDQIAVSASPGTEVRVINPLTGDSSFNFTTSTKQVGDTFVINITVVDVTDMVAWQIRLVWDSTLLNFVSVSLPSDHVFAGESTLIGGPDVGSDNVGYGLALFPSSQQAFSGSGSLCQVVLNISQGVNRQSSLASCTLGLVNSETSLFDPLYHDIFYAPVNGTYTYSWVPPSYNPSITIVPSTIRPSALGEIFQIDIEITDVSPDWMMIEVQFGLMWNTSFMEPTLGPHGSFYDNGTFFESSQYHEDGVIYTVDIDVHEHSPTPLPEGYNYSSCGIVLRADSYPDPPYHPPFPSGSGTLLTMYFEAVQIQTVAPDEEWTMIEFISEDMHVLDVYGLDVPFTSNNAYYRAPVVVNAWQIDLYGGANNDGYGSGYPGSFPAPFGGQGPNQPMDLVFPASEVTFFILVQYNMDPVQNDVVRLFLNGPSYSVNFTALTDENGIAKFVHSMPWDPDNPETYSGLWNAIADESSGGFQDSTEFYYEYPILFMDVSTDKYVYSNFETVYVTAIYGTRSWSAYSGCFVSTLEYANGSMISESWFTHTFGGEWWPFGLYYNYILVESYTIPIGVSGYAYVHENCYDKDPASGGIPFALEYQPQPEILIEAAAHDIAVVDITCTKSILGQTYSTSGNVTVSNLGDYAETFNITVYANSTSFFSQNVTLQDHDFAVLVFSWNTTGYDYGNYLLNAYAWPVPDESNTNNNNCTCSFGVSVGVPGDVTGIDGSPDGRTDMRDIGVICSNFGRTPSHLEWNPNIDLNGDNIINMRDIGIACANFGNHV